MSRSYFLGGLDDVFNETRIGQYFQMKERKTTLSRELNGALATFMSMAYILAVNPRILSDSGGPCQPDDETGNVFTTEYDHCVENLKREYITSTAIASMFGCILMGIVANLPIALAPGMGMNAYFTYSVIGFRGSSSIEYDAAITAILIEGIIFFILSITGIRYALVKLIPEPVKLATPAAIGAFLAHIGLQTAEGIGIVVSDIATAVTLGGCPIHKRTPIVALTTECEMDGICIPSDAYTCDNGGGYLTSGTTWIGMFGFIIILTMLAYRQNSAFIVGICFVTCISWIRNTEITYFTDDTIGNERFEYFKQVVSIEKLDMVLGNYTTKLSNVGVALFTFLYVDFLDTSGTLLGLVSSMGLIDSETGDFPNSRQAFCVDAISTIFGSIFGLSPVTSYIESGAGVAAGSKTGLTAVLCGFFFFLSIFFAPIIASIPPWATGGALIIVGCLMSKSLGKVKWYDPIHASTAFITVMIMPLTYSIAYGLIAGIGTYIITQSIFYILSFVGIEKPIFEPEECETITTTTAGGSDGTELPGTTTTKKIREEKDDDDDDPYVKKGVDETDVENND